MWGIELEKKRYKRYKCYTWFETLIYQCLYRFFS
ncbi:hypothetical protein [Enterococcus phage vB_Efs19_KEN07]